MRINKSVAVLSPPCPTQAGVTVLIKINVVTVSVAHPLDVRHSRLSSLSAATGHDHSGSSLGQVDGCGLPDPCVTA